MLYAAYDEVKTVTLWVKFKHPLANSYSSALNHEMLQGSDFGNAVQGPRV
jgi:hypothetical protein